jgi:F0F1-type ATP synthase assembly protein I
MQRLQENLRRDEPGILASYTLVGAVVVLGGIGYGVDVWNGTSPWFLLSGLVTGIILGFVNLVKIIWRR